MANKYHMKMTEQAISRRNNLDRASQKAGIKFESVEQQADYNATLAADRKRKKNGK